MFLRHEFGCFPVNPEGSCGRSDGHRSRSAHPTGNQICRPSTESRFPFQPWHLSDGTLRFICLATALLQPSPPSTIVIDEPELGQHPVAIEALAALMHEAALRTQLVVCTQSPLLLDHFEPEHLVIVERCDGASIFRRLETGPLEQWLDEYSLGELTRRDIVETGPRYG